MIAAELDVSDFEDLYKLLETSRFIRGMEQAVKEMEGEALRNFRRTVSTWRRQPQFTAISNVDVSEGVAEFLIGTDDAVYGYVDRGTPPHIIRPVRAKALAFRGGYSAKTTLGELRATKGGASGETVVVKVVHHPGVEARRFSETIMAKVDEQFPKIALEQVRREWAKQQGNKPKGRR